MSVIRIWSPAWNAAVPEHAATLLEIAPRIALAPHGVWADARGVDARTTAERLVARIADLLGDMRVHAGLAAVAIAAELAARSLAADGGDTRVSEVPLGDERACIAPMPVELLDMDEPLRMLLHGVGIETCGAFAALEQEAVEVRFGA